jgi:3-oxoacyl-[acyl-carrier-protein] synthase-1/3-oxoacyl-[acyl-carrier-protein] synthase II
VSDVAIIASGAVSGLGEGRAATSAGAPGERARVAITRDEELAGAGLARPFVARAALGNCADRATTLLVRALSSCVSELERVRPSWRHERVGLLLGTSSGGMRAAERTLAALARGEGVADGEAATYFGPMARAARLLGRPLDPCILVLGACASSVLAVGLGVRTLGRDACDVVLAGGFDDVTVFVAAGFEALRATTATTPPRPFRVGRDGMSLGEGAAVLALARYVSQARLFVTGFGTTSDAVHLTAPDREGSGLARAACAALDEAGRPHIDLVSPHATATPFNDPAEARAIARALPDQAPPVVHPFKAQIGHTLGAAGALELLCCRDAIVNGVLPAAAGEGPTDPDASVRLLDVGTPGIVHAALKLACAFGGANAALVLAASPGGPTRRPRPVFVRAAAHAETEPPLESLAASTRCTVDRLARADALVRLALAAVAALQARCGSTLAGAGILVGSALATVETNARFAARIREHGARAAAPRLFPYTSPNAVAGECSMAFGLTGPSFAVGGGLHAGLEALAAGALLVEGGNAEALVVVAVDEGGPVTRALAGDTVRSGAVAVLLTASSQDATRKLGEFHVRRGTPTPTAFGAGHQALLPLLEDSFTGELAAGSPPDASATVRIEPL